MNKRKAFTLIELLVVVSIIALLVSILLPALGRARDMAKATVCTSNLKGIYLAAALFSNDHNDYVVPHSFAWADPFEKYDQNGPTGEYSPNPGSLEPYLSADREQEDNIFACPSATKVEFFDEPGQDGKAALEGKELKCTYGANAWATLYTGNTYAGQESGSAGQGFPFYGPNNLYWNERGKSKMSGIHNPNETVYFMDFEVESIAAWSFNPLKGPFMVPLSAQSGWHGKKEIEYRNRDGETAWYGYSNIAWFDGHVSKNPDDFLDEPTGSRPEPWTRYFYRTRRN